MAKRRRRKGKLNIQHFRGLHEFPTADERTFTRYINGLIDDPAGDLARLGGKVCFGSNPLGSVWSINQVRFKGNWGIVVQNTSSRIWYDHNPYKGPEGPIIDDGGADDVVTIIPGHIVPGDKDGDRDGDEYEDKPGIVPAINCHSDLQVQYGIWEYPVTDLRLCYRSRASGWVGTGATACEAIDGLWDIFQDYYPGPWSNWAVNLASWAAMPMPLLTVEVQWRGAPAPPRFAAALNFREVQYSMRSDQLANPPTAPTGGTYNKATGTISGGVASFNLDDLVGNSDAAIGVACGSGDMPLSIAKINGFSRREAKGLDSTTYTIQPCTGIPAADHNVWKDIFDYSPTYDPDETKLILMVEGGVFTPVWSHFES